MATSIDKQDNASKLGSTPTTVDYEAMANQSLANANTESAKVDYAAMANKSISDATAGTTSTIGPKKSTLGEMGKQLVGGVVSDIPMMAGQAIQAFAPDTSQAEQYGKEMAASAKQRGEDYKPDLEGRGEFAKTAIQASRAIAPSAATGASYFIPGVGPALGSIATAAFFGGSQYQDTKERALAAGLTPEVAHDTALKTGIIQGGGEVLANSILGKTLGLASKAFAGKTIAEKIAAATSPEVLKPFLKGTVGSIAGEGLTEASQDIGTKYVENKAGIGDTRSYGQLAKESASVGGMMALLLSPLGLHSHYGSAQRANAVNNVLDDPAAASKDARTKIVDMIHKDAKDSGIKSADSWKETALGNIARDEPIARSAPGEE